MRRYRTLLCLYLRLGPADQLAMTWSAWHAYRQQIDVLRGGADDAS